MTPPLICEGCGKPSSHWYSKLKLCDRCLGRAVLIRATVPDLDPRPTLPSDPRIPKWQGDADMVVQQSLLRRLKAVTS